ncbi:MAG: hypothetical protein ACYTGV_05570 [Planctomycetota bacterium]|jgi:hypothetical protein
MFDDLKKQQRGGLPPKGSGVRSPADLALLRVGNPKFRILLLVGLLVLLVAIVIALKGYAKTPHAKRVTEDVPSIEMAGEAALPDGVPTLDLGYLDKIVDATPEEAGRWDEEAIAYLLTEAKSTPAVHAYSRRLMPITRGSAAQIEKDPKVWRFQFVSFRGRIEFMREEDYGDAFGGDESIGQVHYGRIRLDEQEPPLRVYFVTPNLPAYKDQNEAEPIPEIKIIRDGWVRGRGIFVKKFNDVGPDGEFLPTLLVVVTKLQRDFDPVEVTNLEQIPFGIIDDDPSVLSTTRRGMNVMFKTYPRPLFRLVKYVEARAGEEGKALREKEALEQLSIDEPEDYEEVIAQPARFRVKYFAGLGATAMDTLYVGPEEMSDDDVNDAGVSEYVTGWVVTDRDRLFKFAAPASVGRDLAMKTRVRFEGYFYKTQGYYARDGSWRMVPFFVLTVLEEVKPTPRDHTFQIGIAIGFIVGICLLIFIIVREDKTKESYRRQHRRRGEAT